MDTRTKILTTALSIFNQEGVDNTSIRRIARDVGISHGNLRYHFSSKEAIIMELFNMMSVEMDEQVKIYLSYGSDIKAFIETARYSAKVFLKYRFIMNDVIGISRQFAPLKTALQINYNKRKQQFFMILTYLVQMKLVKPEPFPNYYKKFIDNGMLVNDFWVPISDLYYSVPETDKIEQYFRSWIIYLLPVLTEKGLEEVQQHVSFE